MNANIKLIAVAAGTFTMAGVAANNYFKTVRRERAARAEIVKDSFLYLAASAAAQARIEEKLKSADYRPNVYDIANDFHDEVAFELIALRYDK